MADPNSVDIAKKTQVLANRVSSLFKEAAKLWPKVNFDAHRGVCWADDAIEVCICEEECNCDAMEELPLGRDVFNDDGKEFTPVPLPSSFSQVPSGWKRVASLEQEMRVAQADEALEALRVAIGHKSFLYLENRDWATGKRERTRGYDRINAVEDNMRKHIKIYKSARWALIRLGLEDTYPQFRPLTRADTKAVTAVYNPNKRGDRNAGASWIWRRNAAVDDGNESPGPDNGDYMDEGAVVVRFVPPGRSHGVSPLSVPC